MANSLGEGSEGGIFDQTLTRPSPIQKSHEVEVEVWLGRGMLVLCSTAAGGLEIDLLQKQGLQDCENQPHFVVFRLTPTHPPLKSAVHMLLK